MMTQLSLNEFPTLSSPIVWGPVHATFALTKQTDEKWVSNVSIVPYTEQGYVIFQIESGMWELPGGTLEPGEHYLDGLRREVMEELGGQLESYTIFGQFNCKSDAEHPYRAHIPHPNFVRIMGFGQVSLVGEPLNPPDGEQVVAVEVVQIEEAIRRFESVGRSDLAELYLAADFIRKQMEVVSNGNSI
ncbi:NUDIX hydrolase [Paenibacillus sp. strain BS8-2]